MPSRTVPLTLGQLKVSSGTGSGFSILMEYDLVAEDRPLSSMTVRAIVYRPGSRKVWLTEETLYTGSLSPEISQIV